MEEKSIWRQKSCRESNNACPMGIKVGCPPCPTGSVANSSGPQLAAGCGARPAAIDPHTAGSHLRLVDSVSSEHLRVPGRVQLASD